MNCLSDDLLIEAYNKAIELGLSEDFIQMIKDELNKRAIHYVQ